MCSDQMFLCFFPFLLGFLRILSSSCDMLENIFLSLFDKGNVIFISFGVGLSDDGSDLFLLIVFSDFYVSVESSPVLFSDLFLFTAIVISSLISSVKSTPKILLEIPLFSLLFLVYAIIGICTIEVTANT